MGLWERSPGQGHCASACTLILGNPKACAERAALFGFHQARSYNKETMEIQGSHEGANKVLWASYPILVQLKLGELKPNMVWIKGTELLPACK